MILSVGRAQDAGGLVLALGDLDGHFETTSLGMEVGQ